MDNRELFMADEVEPRPVAKRIGVVLRWIVLLPAAFLGSIIASAIITVPTRWVLTWCVGLPLESTIGQNIIDTEQGLALSFCFVFIGAYIAPAYKYRVAVGHISFVYLLAAFLWIGSIFARDVLAIFTYFPLIMGGSGAFNTIIKLYDL